MNNTTAKASGKLLRKETTRTESVRIRGCVWGQWGSAMLWEGSKKAKYRQSTMLEWSNIVTPWVWETSNVFLGIYECNILPAGRVQTQSVSREHVNRAAVKSHWSLRQHFDTSCIEPRDLLKDHDSRWIDSSVWSESEYRLMQTKHARTAA